MQSPRLCASLGLLLVVLSTWCVLKSMGPVNDIQVIRNDGSVVQLGPGPTLFDRFHWLWIAILFVPGIAMGAMTAARTSFPSSAFAYGAGLPLGWSLVFLSRVLADPSLKFLVSRFLLWYSIGGLVLGLMLAALGLGGRRLAVWSRKTRVSRLQGGKV